MGWNLKSREQVDSENLQKISLAIPTALIISDYLPKPTEPQLPYL